MSTDYSNPQTVQEFLVHQRGNPQFGIGIDFAFKNTLPADVTRTKAGLSKNIPPPQIPPQLIGRSFPQYSSNSHALLETDRVGVQVGVPDLYRDSPYQQWTYGVQFYTPFVGRNPKQMIPPYIIPSFFPDNENEGIQDITEQSMNYSCRSCEPASLSLGLPPQYATRPGYPYSVLPVNLPGDFPNIGQYQDRTIGLNTGDWPQPQNPIIQNIRRNSGLATDPYPQLYDEQTSGWLRSGFETS